MKYYNTATQCTEKLQAYSEFPKGSQREAYENLPASLKDEILHEGEKYLKFRFPAILATDYMEFVRSGNRVDIENVYFEKRHALCSLTLAECVEYEGRFIDDIINGIFSICEESGWQLPAHNTYIRDTPQHILPDAGKPVIDLFAAETGALIAWAYYLLSEKLDEISPFINTRILSELHKRIFTPYTTSHFWWMGEGDEKMCNWTAWCTQNVLLSTFLVPCDETLQKKIFIQAGKSLDYFTKDYGEDGCCDEGAGYYRHAGLCLFGALHVLNYVSHGKFNKCFKDEKLKNIATYIVNVHAADDYYFNFADCAAKPGRCGVREYLFGKAVGSPELRALASGDFKKSNGKLYTGAKDQINLFYILMACFHYEEVINYNLCYHNCCDNSSADSSPDFKNGDAVRKDVFYKSAGLFIARSDTFALAVKAGNNDDNHNHNDTGSFILYKNGMPLFADIGVESYTKKTFSKHRYEIWTMQSCYHNLPTINGTCQSAGDKYRAEDVHHEFKDGHSEISMELINAYPLSDGSYRRALRLDKADGKVMLTDITSCHGDIILNFILCEKPVFNDSPQSMLADGSSLQADLTSQYGGVFYLGAHAKCVFSGAEFFDLETLSVTDKRLQQSWEHDLYRLRLKLNKNESPAHNERSFHLTIY